MNKFFVCLGNSYKHENRCLAGALVEKTQAGFELLLDSWRHPIWFRPINRYTDGGAIPNSVAEPIDLFDVVEVTNVSHCPDGAQTENYYYSDLSVVGSMNPTKNLLDALSKTNRKMLFGTVGAAVPLAVSNQLDYSILMIKTTDVECYLKNRDEYNKPPKPRMKFTFGEHRYDLPITDPVFLRTVKNNIDEANSHGTYYLTLSLSLPHEGCQFKLVSGVVALGNRSDSPKSKRTGISETAEISYGIFCDCGTIEGVAERRGLAYQTIVSHLVPFVEMGEIDVHTFVSDGNIRRVTNYMADHPNETHLKPIFEYFDGEISYDDIRFVLASLKG